MTKITYIPGEIANAAIDEHGNRKPVTRTQHIFDDAKGKSQADINKEFGNAIGGLNNQNYATVDSYNALPDTGEADTVYRVSNWDGTQQDPSVYSEYAWNGEDYVHLSTKTQIGEVFDISAYHATGGTLATYADLSAALDSNNGGGVPQSLQKGGMSIKFVQSSDNKYLQFRFMLPYENTTAGNAAFLNVDNWQGVDDEPIKGSNNFVKSGGVDARAHDIEKVIGTDINNFVNNNFEELNLKAGHSYKLKINSTTTRYIDFKYKVDDEAEEVRIGTIDFERYDSLTFTPEVDTKYIRQTAANDTSWSVTPIKNIDERVVDLKAEVVQLEQALTSLRNSGYSYKGIANINSNPGTPTENSFYIVRGAGTYTNFKNSNNESIVFENDGIYVLKYDAVTNNYWESDTIIELDSKPVTGSNRGITSHGVTVIEMGTEKPSTTMHINKQYITQLFPVKAGETYIITLTEKSGNNVLDFRVIRENGATIVQLPLTLNVPYSYTATEDGKGFHVGCNDDSITIDIVAKESINEKIARVNTSLNNAITNTNENLNREIEARILDTNNILTISRLINALSENFTGNTFKEVNLKAGYKYRLQINDTSTQYLDFSYKVDDESDEVKIATIDYPRTTSTVFTPEVDTKYIRQTAANTEWSIIPERDILGLVRTEIARATLAEQNLQQNINNENTRATGAENSLLDKIFIINRLVNALTRSFSGVEFKEVNLKAGYTYTLQVDDNLQSYMDFRYKVDDESDWVKITTVTSKHPYTDFTPAVDTKYIAQTSGMSNWRIIPKTDILTLISNVNTRIDNLTTQVINDEIVDEGKVDVAYKNILVKSDILDGSAYGNNGGRIENASWLGIFGTILLPWRGQQYLTANNLWTESGLWIWQYDKNKNPIQGSGVHGFTGTHTFERVAGAFYIGLCFGEQGYLNREIIVNYGQTLLTDTSTPNPIKKYIESIENNISEIEQDIQDIEDTISNPTLVTMYAYGNGNDATPDDDTHFYGWKNNKCAWQRAIDAADGVTPTIIYCKGHIKVTQQSQFTTQEDGFGNVVFIPTTESNIQLIGEGPERTSLVVEMPDDFAQYSTHQPMGIYGDNSLVKGMFISGKNCRYCVHVDASGRNIGTAPWADNHKITFQDMEFRHYENAGHSFNLAFACCASDGMTILAERCKIVQEDTYTAGVYTHDNKDYNKGGVLIFKDCVFENSRTTGVNIALLQMLGSNNEYVIQLDNIDFGGNHPIIMVENNNANTKTDKKKYEANNHYTIKGSSVDYPIGIHYRNSTSGVLRVTSKSTGSNSSVRFDKTSSAFDILVRGLYKTDYTENTGIVHVDGYHYRDGIGVLHGYAMGELALDTGRIVSIQNRLGDCSQDNKVLVVTVDGTDYTITFDQDYTNYSDADMLAVFTDALSSVADVELYNWGQDYFPEITPNLRRLRNTSEEVILVGMGVTINGGDISKAVSDDRLDAIAIDDIVPGKYGRIVTKATLSIYASRRFHICLENTPDESDPNIWANYRSYFGIGSTPGVFVSKGNDVAPVYGALKGGWTYYLTISK